MPETIPFKKKELAVRVHNPNNLPVIDFHKLKELQGDLKITTPAKIEKLKNSIVKYGIFVPKFIWIDSNTHYIEDGHQTIKALTELEKGGYTVPPIPYVEIQAKDRKDAGEKLLMIDSRFADINPDTSFFKDFDTGLEFMEEIEIPELELNFEGGEGDGEEVEHTKLTDKFIVPPFSILDTRQGYWQERKRAWISLGIKGEEGREEGLIMSPDTVGHMDFYSQKRKWEAKNNKKISTKEWTEIINNKKGHTYASNELMDIKGGFSDNLRTTSIFDPVLTEIAYKWFCTDKGTILDPFAGGSVRGIVAAYLGYIYTGIELCKEQVESNEKQWAGILKKNKVADKEPIEEFKEVKISHKWLNHKFLCNKEYITSHCHGKCCEGADKVIISLLPEETKEMLKQGYSVIDNLLQPDINTGKCPFKMINGLCNIHNTDLKPFGCIASPFTLNDNDTLIIRNRYSLMKCHGKGEPSHITFKSSLDLIFGEEEADRICAELKTHDNDFIAKMPISSYSNLKYLDSLKHEMQKNMEGNITWHIGNAETVKEIVGNVKFDFIFSCPPYYNLEVYSELKGELSAAKTYEKFLIQYHSIISKSVALLKEDRFACFVVSDIRDKEGFYRNFVSDTIAGFENAGMRLYNEAILVNVIGSLPIRIQASFGLYRKLGKSHQNVLVFYKGDPKKIKDNYSEIEVAEIEEEKTEKTI